MGRILPEAIPFVVALRDHVRVDHGPQAYDREQLPADQDGRQRTVYQLDDHEDHTLAYLAVVDLTRPGDDEARDGGS